MSRESLGQIRRDVTRLRHSLKTTQKKVKSLDRQMAEVYGVIIAIIKAGLLPPILEEIAFTVLLLTESVIKMKRRVQKLETEKEFERRRTAERIELLEKVYGDLTGRMREEYRSMVPE